MSDHPNLHYDIPIESSSAATSSMRNAWPAIPTADPMQCAPCWSIGSTAPQSRRSWSCP